MEGHDGLALLNIVIFDILAPITLKSRKDCHSNVDHWLQVLWWPVGKVISGVNVSELCEWINITSVDLNNHIFHVIILYKPQRWPVPQNFPCELWSSTCTQMNPLNYPKHLLIKMCHCNYIINKLFLESTPIAVNLHLRSGRIRKKSLQRINLHPPPVYYVLN